MGVVTTNRGEPWLPLLAPLRITTYAADRHPLYLEAICRIVSQDGELELLGSGRTGGEARDDVARLRPAVAILDIDDGDARHPSTVDIVALGAALPTRVLCLSSSVDGETVHRCLAAGVAGYLSKGSYAGTIQEAVVAISRGETVLDPQLQDAFGAVVRQTLVYASLPVLTERECQVLQLTADGLTAAGAGAHLGVSWTTVRSHLGTSFAKLGVTTQAAAVATALRRGLII